MRIEPALDDAPLICYACGDPAAAECESCGQGFCDRHRGVAPRLDWCAECVGNAKVEDALGWTISGCMLGLVAGMLLWVLTLLVFAPLAQGPGRGFVMVVGTGLICSAAAFVIRRGQLR